MGLVVQELYRDHDGGFVRLAGAADPDVGQLLTWDFRGIWVPELLPAEPMDRPQRVQRGLSGNHLGGGLKQ